MRYFIPFYFLYELTNSKLKMPALTIINIFYTIIVLMYFTIYNLANHG